MCVAVGRELLFSGGSDRCLRSWQADTLDKVGEVKVRHLNSFGKCRKFYLPNSLLMMTSSVQWLIQELTCSPLHML